MLSSKPENRAIAWLRGRQGLKCMEIEATASEPTAFSFFAPDFALSSAQPWFVGRRAELNLEAQVLPEILHRALPSSADFIQLHEDILTRIRTREFEKVVPIVCEEIQFANSLHASMFHLAIQMHFQDRYNYGFEFKGEGLCGVTPEVLFEVRDGVLRTMALAGTAPVAGPSLLLDKKEIHEHEIVIEHISCELKTWGEVQVGTTDERTFGDLKHLYTPLELRLQRDISFMDLVVRLHPTAALGGWPRRAAIEWLEAQDFHFSRRRFGAPFGYVDGDEMFCVVAIRGLQWQGARALLSAGCGVVSESVALREWDELRLKRKTTARFLGMEQ